MAVYKLERDILAKLVINNERMPLSNENKEHVVNWLRQMAVQFERGELFSSSIFELRIPEKKK
jgi:hypothetical protein